MKNPSLMRLASAPSTSMHSIALTGLPTATPSTPCSETLCNMASHGLRDLRPTMREMVAKVLALLLIVIGGAVALGFWIGRGVNNLRIKQLLGERDHYEKQYRNEALCNEALVAQNNQLADCNDLLRADVKRLLAMTGNSFRPMTGGKKDLN